MKTIHQNKWGAARNRAGREPRALQLTQSTRNSAPEARRADELSSRIRKGKTIPGEAESVTQGREASLGTGITHSHKYVG